jgi:hypothetical protein
MEVGDARDVKDVARTFSIEEGSRRWTTCCRVSCREGYVGWADKLPHAGKDQIQLVVTADEDQIGGT